jgi:hypothetical protein
MAAWRRPLNGREHLSSLRWELGMGSRANRGVSDHLFNWHETAGRTAGASRRRLPADTDEGKGKRRRLPWETESKEETS